MHLHPNIRNHLEFISHFSKKEVFVSNLRKRQKRPKNMGCPQKRSLPRQGDYEGRRFQKGHADAITFPTESMGNTIVKEISARTGNAG